MAIGFLGVGLYVVLLDLLPPAQAALAVASTGLAVAGVVAAITVAAVRRARRSVGTALRAGAVATLAPPAVRLAACHVGVAGVVAVAGLAFLAARRK